MLLFRGRKAFARKLPSPTVSLFHMRCFIAYARFLESFSQSVNVLHNIDTVYLIYSLQTSLSADIAFSSLLNLIQCVFSFYSIDTVLLCI